ncbi:MAG: hypothetical protein IT478_09975, partial [Xanthomonadales bacterium]|nr:hypothetical protein [Xanthomonadales bacterium]
VDVVNVFNSQDMTEANEVGEDSNGSAANAAPTYLTPAAWQQPRYFRLSAQYDF